MYQAAGVMPFASAQIELPTPATTAAALRNLLPDSLQNPQIAIVCGSGLSGLSDLLDDRVDIPYARIDGFEGSTGERKAKERIIFSQNDTGYLFCTGLTQSLDIKASSPSGS